MKIKRKETVLVLAKIKLNHDRKINLFSTVVSALKASINKVATIDTFVMIYDFMADAIEASREQAQHMLQRQILNKYKRKIRLFKAKNNRTTIKT